MSCCGIKWREKTVRERMLGKLGMGELAAFGVLLLLVGLFVGLTMSSHGSLTESEMKASVVSSVGTVLGDLSRRLEQQFGRWMRDLKIRALIQQDVWRTDYPWKAPNETAPLYMDDPSLMPANIRTYLPQYKNGTIPITFVRGSYHVPHRTPSAISSFSRLLNQSIALHFVMDSVAIRQYNESGGAFASTYVASLGPAERVFKENPGVGQTNILAYDLFTDPLAVQAMLPENIESFTFSEAYVDPYVGQPMITVLVPFRNINLWGSSTAYGLAGVDIILSVLAKVVAGLQFANVSRAAIFEADAATPVIDSDLAHIMSQPIFSDVEAKSRLIQGASQTEVNVEDTGDYLYFGRQLSTNDYVVVNRVPMSFVDERMAQIRANDRLAAGIVAGSIVASAVVVFALTMYCIHRAVIKTTRPLRKLREVVAEIPEKHIGAAAARAGAVSLVPVPQHLPDLVTEEERLLQSVQTIVPLFNETRKLREQPINDQLQVYKPPPGTVLLLPASLAGDEKAPDKVNRAKRELTNAYEILRNGVQAAERKLAQDGGESLRIANRQLRHNWPLILLYQAIILKDHDGDVASARAVATFILGSFERLEESVKRSCLQLISSHAAPGSPLELRLGDGGGGGGGGGSTVLRFWVFLDVSGSMQLDTPPRIVLARAGLNKLFRNPMLVRDNSEIHLSTFSTNVQQIWPPTNTGLSSKARGPLDGDDHKSLFQAVEYNTTPDGSTALYRAINRGYDAVLAVTSKEDAKTSSKYSNFIFVITDGVNSVDSQMATAEDTAESIQRRPAPNARVGIFTVGNILSMEGGYVAQAELTAIANAVGKTTAGKPKGCYRSLDSIERIFEEINQIIIDGATEAEVL